ncbi:MAG: hypothetical protein WC343_12175, partial [Bacilli bacterium]
MGKFEKPVDIAKMEDITKSPLDNLNNLWEQQQKSKFKIERQNKFKKFKIKPLIIAAILVGGLSVGGLIIHKLSNKKPVDDHNTWINSTESLVSPGEVSSINTDYFSLADFNKIITPSISADKPMEQYDIDNCQIIDDNYNV